MHDRSKIFFQPSGQEKGQELTDMNEEEMRGGGGGGGGERQPAIAPQRLVRHDAVLGGQREAGRHN